MSDANIALDNQGRYWMSMDGIFLLDERMNSVKKMDRVNSSLLPRLEKDERGELKTMYWHPQQKRLYFFTNAATGMFCVDVITGEVDKINIPVSRKYGWVSAMTYNPSNGHLLFMYDTTLCEWDYRSRQLNCVPVKADPGYLKKDYLQSTSILIDSVHHCYWISDFWNGVIRYDYLTGQTRCYSDRDDFPITNNIKAKAVIGSHVYFISHHGICRFNHQTEKFEKLATPDTSANGTFRFNDLVLDEMNHSIWLSSQKGLYHYFPESGKWEHFTSDQGLQTGIISDLSLIGNEELVITYDWGIFRYSVKTRTSITYPYDLNVSLYNVLLTDDRSVFFEHDLEFWKGDLQDWISAAGEFPLVITSIREHDRELIFPGSPDSVTEINLNLEQDFVNISFALLNYTFSSRIEYRYRLEGLNDDWVSTKGSTEAGFGNLSPGHYVFHLRAKGMDGAWQERKNPLHIIVHPAWWDTAWFRILLVSVALLILYAAYRYRVSEMERLQNVRNTIARDLHDDVGSTLSSIRIMSTVAEMSPDQSKELVKKIKENSQRMLESMSDIVWAVNPDNDTMEKILVRMNMFAAQMLEPKGILFEVSAEGISKLELPMERRKDLYLIFKEGVNNLAKYSDCSKAAIEISSHVRILKMKISDNGNGFEVNHVSLGNGLINMKKRAEKMGGTLSVQSEPGKGTMVELTFPVT